MTGKISRRCTALTPDGFAPDAFWRLMQSRQPVRTRCPPMWNRPRFDLKVRLTLRVAAISAGCFAAISAYFLITADRAAHARLDDIAPIVAKTLELQQGKIQWVASPRSGFPNLDPVSAYVMTPGLCLAFRGTSGDVLQRFCSGAPARANPPPQVFTASYRSLFAPGREA